MPANRRLGRRHIGACKRRPAFEGRSPVGGAAPVRDPGAAHPSTHMPASVGHEWLPPGCPPASPDGLDQGPAPGLSSLEAGSGFLSSRGSGKPSPALADRRWELLKKRRAPLPQNRPDPTFTRPLSNRRSRPNCDIGSASSGRPLPDPTADLLDPFSRRNVRFRESGRTRRRCRRPPLTSLNRASVTGGGLCLRIGRDGGAADASGRAPEATDVE
jgi:hypothetical protein